MSGGNDITLEKVIHSAILILFIIDNYYMTTVGIFCFGSYAGAKGVTCVCVLYVLVMLRMCITCVLHVCVTCALGVCIACV